MALFKISAIFFYDGHQLKPNLKEGRTKMNTTYRNVVDIRTYTLVTIQGETQLACFTQKRWEIDATCESINDLLRAGLVCEDSINGWIERRAPQKEG